MMMDIKLCANAFVQLLKVLNKEYTTVYSYNLFNNGRHSIMKPVNTDEPVFYALYKTDFFNSFNKFYPDEPSGVGESINEEWLNLALDQEVDYLAFIYPTGFAYKISPKLVKKYCESRDLIRTQHDGEVTYVFPVMFLERLGV